MKIQVQKAEYREIEAMRELYRQEANCQIIHDSILRRGLADAYLVLVEGKVGGYGGVWNKYDPGMLMEFYTLPDLRSDAKDLCRELLVSSQATQMEAQTNMPLMTLALWDFAKNIRAENVLFADGFRSGLICPGGTFRRHRQGDPVNSEGEPEGDWVLEVGGQVVANGGFLCHYNPPYGDLYMSVPEGERQKGYGSYMVQELKKVCYEAGKKPAARCNATNTASRKTLQRAGMLPVGRLLVGEVDPEKLSKA